MSEQFQGGTEQQAPDVVVAEFREKAEKMSRYGWDENEIAAALRELACDTGEAQSNGGDHNDCGRN
jgi:hypothetical protein